MSPVWSHPPRIASAVSSGSRQYPSMTVPERQQISPTSPTGQLAGQRSSRIRTSVPATGRPTEPGPDAARRVRGDERRRLGEAVALADLDSRADAARPRRPVSAGERRRARRRAGSARTGRSPRAAAPASSWSIDGTTALIWTRVLLRELEPGRGVEPPHQHARVPARGECSPTTVTSRPNAWDERQRGQPADRCPVRSRRRRPIFPASQRFSCESITPFDAPRRPARVHQRGELRVGARDDLGRVGLRELGERHGAVLPLAGGHHEAHAVDALGGRPHRAEELRRRDRPRSPPRPTRMRRSSSRESRKTAGVTVAPMRQSAW